MSANIENLYLNDNLIEMVNHFTYLGSIVGESGGTGTDEATKIHKDLEVEGILHWNETSSDYQQCKVGPFIQLRDVESHSNYYKAVTGTYKQMPP
jgi:hypothetical protein